MTNDMTQTPEQPASSSKPSRAPWLVGLALMLAALGAGGYLWFTSTSVEPAEVVAPVETPEVAPAAAVVSIADADARARALFDSLSAELSKLFPGGGLLGRIVAAVQLASEDEGWLQLFSALRPDKPFKVVGRGGRTFIAKESYARYDGVTSLVVQIDSTALAAAYTELKPALDQLFAEVSRPGASFDAALSRALAPVMRAEINDAEVEVVPKGLVWAFKDSAKESMDPTSKLMARLGPSNAKKLQASVRAFATAAKLPAAQ